jgi:DNA-directed RNA polymerase subunit M
MGINFCTKCRGLLSKQENNWVCLVCSSINNAEDMCFVEKTQQKSEISIINEKDSEILPKIEWKCPRCKNNEAYFWHAITTAADEADTIYYRCSGCNYAMQKGGQRGGR